MQSQAFPKILALGHRLLKDLFDGPVEITEKLDGSQFGFGRPDEALVCRSKRCELDLENPDGLFRPAVESVLKIQHLIPPGWFFWSETIAKPKHNVLTYGRVPKKNIALFGATNGVEMMGYGDLCQIADNLGVDVVPCLFYGHLKPDVQLWEEFLKEESYLGGPKIEGFVVKNYAQRALIGDTLLDPLCGKFVSEAFKEKHAQKPYKGKQHWAAFCDSFRTEARWQKALQHLREDGKITGEPKDIGALVLEVQRDILEEHTDEIKEFLWKHFQRDLIKGAVNGLPEWYKLKLATEEVV